MNTSPRAAVLWTGGKDCALAMHLSMEAGADIICLVTFVPPDARFLSHPLPVMQAQAEAVGRPWHRIEIVEPYADSYRNAFIRLRDEKAIDTIVTGDIAEVDGYPNWVRRCAEGLDVEVSTPLWGLSRAETLDALVGNSFAVTISAVKLSALDRSWIGREIDRKIADELLALQEDDGVDACGENGEFHTIVTYAPFFAHRIPITLTGVYDDGDRAYAELCVTDAP